MHHEQLTARGIKQKNQVLYLSVHLFSPKGQFWEVNIIPLNSLVSRRIYEIEDKDLRLRSS